MTPLVIALLLVPMVALPLLFNWIAARIERGIEESRTWPSVEGVMTRSKKYQSKGVWYPSLVYAYSVQGRELRSSRYCFGTFNGTRAEVQELLDRYPEGGTVQVFYDSTRPKRAVLERTGQAKAFRLAGWVLCGAFVLFFAVVFFATR